MHLRVTAGLLLTGLLLPAWGCGKKAAPLPQEDQHILKALKLYQEYMNAHNRKPPESMEKLKTWAQTLKPEQLEKLKIDNLETAFVSPRDGQPYGLAPPGPKERMGMSPVTLYEKVGVKGKHITASMGSFREIDEKVLKQYVPNL
jgi:hypothetical protein